MAATVSARLARQASPAACAIVAGSRRAMVTMPVSVSSSFLACQERITSGNPGSGGACSLPRRRSVLRCASRLAKRRPAPMRRPPRVLSGQGQCAP